MKKLWHTLAVFFLVQLFCVSILGDASAEKAAELSIEGKKILAQGEGQVTETAIAEIARKLSFADFTAAFYGANRAYRRVALDAVAFVDSPWEYVPYLISFMEASERQVASTAAASLFETLERVFDLRQSSQFPLAAQAAQIQGMLAEVAKNDSLETDIRVQAVRAMYVLSTDAPISNRVLKALLADESMDVRSAVLSGLHLPLPDELLEMVATVASSDVSPEVRGAAVAVICENALSHNVSVPSADLKALVLELLAGRKDEAVIAPMLGCIARFPYRTRADVSDRINNCGNEKIVKYWKSLSY